MNQEIISKWHALISQGLDNLPYIGFEEFDYKPSENQWSKKEILGHLIDSASHNHHRIIRAQFEESPKILYQQNDWCHYGSYQSMKTTHLIEFWGMYNKHLILLVLALPVTSLKRKVSFENISMSIEELISDYIKHLEHHLNQILQ